MPGDPDAPGIDEIAERVKRRVQAGVEATLVLGRMAGGGSAARSRRVRRARLGEQEVKRVLGAVEERLAGLGGKALGHIWSLAVRVGATLALDVVGEHDVAVLGEHSR